ncbi:dsDNA nuclease domain-containing protein [Pseudomonas carnis]|uniref:dsDNA nuclease domain-containing protein n=1 Tax=Pseudomonas carnis TaxID=2487355 RepID=UPI001BC91C17|nr:dsDNA nuclease domain-containing protein [Pseudomonas carnis]
MKLHEVKARELNGRDTIHRFKAQFKAASLECLALLEDCAIERVFCDYHEDYVVKFVDDGEIYYRFVQVKTKTKQNHLYNILEIFGIKKTKKNGHDLPNSFAGKMLLHVDNFGDTCHSLVILTNINFDDDVEGLVNDAQSGNIVSKHTATLITETKKLVPNLAVKTDKEVLDFLSHLKLVPRQQILNEDDDNFVSSAHRQIYKYSEINLTPKEIRLLIIQLLSLIESKSSEEIKDSMTEHMLNDKASVTLDDMLDILAISRPAYYLLRNGGDPNAIKSVSILQRVLKRNNYKEETLNSFANFKSQWETWYRVNRHTIQELKLLELMDEITSLTDNLAVGKIDMKTITGAVVKLTTKLRTLLGRNDLTEELVFGAVLSEIVKGESS